MSESIREVRSKRYHFDQATLDLRLPGVGSTDDGVYSCGHCGARWQAENIYRHWPIRFGWSRFSSFGTHGYQIGWDGIERRVFALVISIAWLRIVLGDGWRRRR